MYYRGNYSYRKQYDSMSVAPKTESTIEVPEFDTSSLNIPSLSREMVDFYKNTTDLNDWETNFLKDVILYVNINNKISPAQYKAFMKIKTRFTTEAIEEKRIWATTYVEQYKEDCLLLCDIMTANRTEYWSDIRRCMKTDDAYIPSEKACMSFVANKYSIGYLRNVKGAPKFAVGDAVVPSGGKEKFSFIFNPNDAHHGAFKNAVVLQINVRAPVTHAVGGKVYGILPYGYSGIIQVNEKDMKKVRK